MRHHQSQRRRSARTLGGLAAGLALAVGGPAAHAGTLHFVQSDIALGELIEGATLTQNLALARQGNGASSSTVTYSPGLILGGVNVSGNEVKLTGNNHPTAGSLSVTLDGTAAPGPANWTVQLDSPTNGQDDTVALSATILAHANGSFAGDSDLDHLLIDFGAVTLGSVQQMIVSLFNLPGVAGAAYTADLDLDSFDETDVDDKFSTSLSPNTIAADQHANYTVTFDTTSPGSFSAAYTLYLSDEDLPGATAQTLSIAVQGTVIPIPEPASVALFAAAGAALLRRRR